MIVWGFVIALKNQLFDAEFLYFTITKMKQLTVKATKQLLNLKDRLENYWDLSGYFAELYNILSDFDGEDMLYDYISVEDAEEMAKQQLEDGWLARLYYFMWDVNRNTAELIHLDWYWNCEEATSEDLIDIIDDVIDNYWADADIYEDNEE